MVVPKRTVALLDRLMHILSETLKEVEEELDQQNLNHDNNEIDEYQSVKNLANKRMSNEQIAHEPEYNGTQMI